MAVDSEAQGPERLSVCFTRHPSDCPVGGGDYGAPLLGSHPGKNRWREQPAEGNGSAAAGLRCLKWRTIDSVGGCCDRGVEASPPERASARVRVWKGAGHSEAIHNLLSAAGLGEARFQGLSGCLLRRAGRPGEGAAARESSPLTPAIAEMPWAQSRSRWELSRELLRPWLPHPSLFWSKNNLGADGWSGKPT